MSATTEQVSPIVELDDRINDDTPLAAREACAYMPDHNGRPIHRSQFYKYAKYGQDGVRLQVMFLGGRLRTTRKWLREFGAAVARARGFNA